MSSHWSLVLFTLVVQSVVGNVWCMQLALFFNGYQLDSLYFKYHIIVALGLVLVGLAAAMAHLGTPAASINAIRNLRRSWLSREIIIVNLFAGVLAVMAVLTFINPGFSEPLMMLVGSLIGGMVLFAMTRVYLLRTVPAWNHAGTPLTFLGSALLLGAVLFALLLNIFAWTMNIGPETEPLAISRNIAFAAISIGLILKMLATGISLFAKSAQPGSLIRSQPVMQTIGFALWAISRLPAIGSVFTLMLLSLATVIMVVGEGIQRVHFYNDYRRVGL